MILFTTVFCRLFSCVVLWISGFCLCLAFWGVFFRLLGVFFGGGLGWLVGFWGFFGWLVVFLLFCLVVVFFFSQIDL